MLALCGGAQATIVGSLGTVNLRYRGASPAGFAVIKIPAPSRYRMVRTGQYNLELALSYVRSTDPAHETNRLYDAATTNPLYPNAGAFVVGTFCADVHENAPPTTSSESAEYDIVMPKKNAPVGANNTAMNTDQVNALRRLYAARIAGIQSGSDNTPPTAFALCVWEIIFETNPTYSVSTGHGEFYSTFTSTTLPGARDLANDWLADVQSSDSVPNIALRVLANDGDQDFAIVVSDFGSAPPIAPEPTTILGLLLEMAAALAARLL